jgi:hypothetical protein
MLSSRHTAAKFSKEATMAKQAADHHKKAEEQHEQAAHQHKQTRRAMGRMNEKKDASCPPRIGLQPKGDQSWD